MNCILINKNTPTNINDGYQSPTLVFDAGMGNWSLFYYPLVLELGELTTICLLDRTGYTDKSTKRTPRDAYSVAQEIRKTLVENNITGPIILVGHSLGGLHVRMYQYLFPENVLGMILLDTAHPYLPAHLPSIKSQLKKQIKQISKIKILARLGILKLARKKIPTFGIPANVHKLYYKITTRENYYRIYQEEMETLFVSLKQCRKIGKLGDLPLLVIGSSYGLTTSVNTQNATKQEDTEWLSLQEDLSRLSTKGIFIKSTGNHFLHITDTRFVSVAIKKYYKNIAKEISYNKKQKMNN